MGFKLNRLIIVCLLLSVLACSAHKASITDTSIQQVVTEGSATLAQGGKLQARREAIDAAVAEAARQFRTDSVQNTRGLLDSKVVDEWQEDNIYHVQILAVWSDKQMCASGYRKKILATAFPVMNADQISVSESQDLYGGIPREIVNQLQESGDFIGRNNTNTVLYERPDLAPEILPNSNYTGSSILNLARQKDAQFILSGVIRDFKIESGEYVRGSGVFSEIKSMLRDMVGRRSIGVDVFVHDGFSGALLFQHRYTDSVVGDVALPAGYTVGSQRFHDTPVGFKVETLVHQASDDIRQFLSCFPFASRVTQVEGNTIVIAAGAQDKVKPGDQFKLYPAAGGLGSAISNVEGLLTITDVAANSAQGNLDNNAQTWSVRPGDWVKSANTR